MSRTALEITKGNETDVRAKDAHHTGFDRVARPVLSTVQQQPRGIRVVDQTRESTGGTSPLRIGLQTGEGSERSKEEKALVSRASPPVMSSPPKR